MAKTKTKTVKVRVGMIYDRDGRFAAGGWWTRGERLDDASLIADAGRGLVADANEFPYACVIDIELPIPTPIPTPVVGKVLQVKAVKAVKP